MSGKYQTSQSSATAMHTLHTAHHFPPQLERLFVFLHLQYEQNMNNEYEVLVMMHAVVSIINGYISKLLSC